jgi:hypothetical protein
MLVAEVLRSQLCADCRKVSDALERAAAASNVGLSLYLVAALHNCQAGYHTKLVTPEEATSPFTFSGTLPDA